MGKLRTKSVQEETDIINALKEKPRTKRELIDILTQRQKSGEAARKKIERYTKYLEQLGLVEEKDDAYCWYFYKNSFENYRDYSSMLQHSKKLIPGLEEIAGIRSSPSIEEIYGIEPEKLRLYVECAEEHLKHYQVYSQLKKKRKLQEKAKEKEDELKNKLKQRVKNEFGGLYNRLPDKKEAVGSNIPPLIYYCIWDKIKPDDYFEYNGSEVWFRGHLIAKGYDVREFVIQESERKDNTDTVKQIKDLEEKALNISKEVEKEIRKIILRIESGEPLLRSCKTCPEVYILNPTK